MDILKTRQSGLIILFLIVIIQSCASILNPKYQKVNIVKTTEADKILIDGEELNVHMLCKWYQSLLTAN